jgi:EpsI family protein
VAVALAASMIANIVRIYLIIVITEWSHRRIAIADDHLLYGWGFFGVIMLAMMWFGARIGVPAPRPQPFVAGDAAWRVPRPLLASGTAAAVLVVAALPVALARATTGAEDGAPMVLMLPDRLGAWERAPLPSTWQPGTVAGDAAEQITYLAEGQALNLAVVGYRAQRDGREAAARLNTPADGKTWEEVARQTAPVTINGHALTVPQVLLRSGNRTRVALSWYVSADCITASRLTAKLCAAKQRLSGNAAPGAFFALSTDVIDTPDAAARLLQTAAARIDPPAILSGSH